jgi:anti-sigma factor RsiW
MKCKVAQERIVAAAYGELAGEQAQELERHLAGCAECGKEQEQLLALKELAGGESGDGAGRQSGGARAVEIRCGAGCTAGAALV